MFLRLVQTLIANVVLKVHVNGRFMEEILLTWGVHQGCPLSPLLFLLSTHPLMDYISHKLTTSNLDGVKIYDNITICHRLFVDDLGIFIPANEDSFQKLQKKIKLYKVVAGAKMNPSKTVIIPLGMLEVPQWIGDIGCKINHPGKIQRYLGTPIGNLVKQSDMHNFCLDKISKCISGWSNRLLSLTGKALLIQHIIHSITIYHMMYMVPRTR